MQEVAAVKLANGMRAEVRADRFTSGFELVVDGTAQSHVDLDDPTHLFFEYIARMGHVIDQLRDPGEPITALHLGAGALTLPRYIAATRPGSRQQVIEIEPELVELGCAIALTMGQQSWLRLLNIEHHQVMAGTAASMAPGFENAEALAKSKAASDYWAKKDRVKKTA